MHGCMDGDAWMHSQMACYAHCWVGARPASPSNSLRRGRCATCPSTASLPPPPPRACSRSAVLKPSCAWLSACAPPRPQRLVYGPERLCYVSRIACAPPGPEPARTTTAAKAGFEQPRQAAKASSQGGLASPHPRTAGLPAPPRPTTRRPRPTRPTPPRRRRPRALPDEPARPEPAGRRLLHLGQIAQASGTWLDAGPVSPAAGPHSPAARPASALSAARRAGGPASRRACTQTRARAHTRAKTRARTHARACTHDVQWRRHRFGQK